MVGMRSNCEEGATVSKSATNHVRSLLDQKVRLDLGLDLDLIGASTHHLNEVHTSFWSF